MILVPLTAQVVTELTGPLATEAQVVLPEPMRVQVEEQDGLAMEEMELGGTLQWVVLMKPFRTLQRRLFNKFSDANIGGFGGGGMGAYGGEEGGGGGGGGGYNSGGSRNDIREFFGGNNGSSSGGSYLIGGTANLTGTVSASNAGNGSANVSYLILLGTAPYTYSWSTTPSQTSQTATGLSAGTYSVTVIHNAGCAVTAAVVVTQPPALAISISSVTNIACSGGIGGKAIANAATGGVSPYTYNSTPSGVLVLLQRV